ncbi:hypothetical protein TNCV_2070381 [Trichonephila clavipes]|uniref:Uncharacterized protein n=1 Tax=Trichonephila clavipes TaxID=2585209 RepID=A0A8X6W3D3_TRICX|nr:hypothetical protein TNCV_2070381 [Trichonephila clavipes]
MKLGIKQQTNKFSSPNTTPITPERKSYSYDKFEGENSGLGPGASHLCVPSTNLMKKDLWLAGYLEYPHAMKALSICKHPYLFSGFEPKPDGRESITGKSPTSFPEEDTVMPYSGLEPKPTRLHVKGHIHRTGWAAKRCLTFINDDS